MTDFKYVSNISRLLRTLDETNIQDFADSLSATQYQSKKWLAETLIPIVKTNNIKKDRIMILGGWYGSYTVPMLAPLQPDLIILNDKDSSILKKAQILHGSLITPAWFDVEKKPELVEQYQPDIIINTSCEHMFDMTNIKLQNKNTLYVFQACNNKNDPGHKNTVKSTADFYQKAGIDDLVYQGRLDLGHKQRFMLIGYKRA